MTITSGEQFGQPTVTASPPRRLVVLVAGQEVRLIVTNKPLEAFDADIAVEILGPIQGDDGKLYAPSLKEVEWELEEAS